MLGNHWIERYHICDLNFHKDDFNKYTRPWLKLTAIPKLYPGKLNFVLFEWTHYKCFFDAFKCFLVIVFPKRYRTSLPQQRQSPSSRLKRTEESFIKGNTKHVTHQSTVIPAGAPVIDKSSECSEKFSEIFTDFQNDAAEIKLSAANWGI